MRKLKEELLQINKKQIDSKKRDATNAGEMFFFFLENGFLPWNSGMLSIAALEGRLYIDTNLVQQLKKLIIPDKVVAARLASHFSEKFTTGIITHLIEDQRLLQPLRLVRESFYSQKNKRLLRTELLKAFADGHFEAADSLIKIKDKEDVPSAVDDLIGIMKKKEISEINEKIKLEKKDEAIYINNAGLILLHPFLQELFSALKLTCEKNWIDDESKHKAVIILEFLATGNNEFEEFNMVLNKILCGIDLKEVIVADQQLDVEIKNECEILLAKLITHWSALKNTSVGGLREAFLQRRGKLSKVEKGWLLQIEHKPVDVLLDRLPWGIGIVRLPWMKDILYTEWN